VLSILFGLVSAACAGCSRGDDSGLEEVVATRSSQARAAAEEAGLPKGVADVVALAARAPAATFSAVYATSELDGTVVVHQRPPRRRVDVVDGSGETVQVFISDGEAATVACDHRPRGWHCAPVPVGSGASSLGAFTPAALDALVAALAGASPRSVLAESATVAGTRARCVRSGPADRLCVSTTGVPLLIERSDGGSSLRATTYRTAVADDDLRRPDD
jgi:hypothetical protein